MSHRRDTTSELLALLDALCEERLTSEQAARLERLVLRDRAARKLYLDYMQLHGTLLWDAACADESTPRRAVADVPSDRPSDIPRTKRKREREPQQRVASKREPATVAPPSRRLERLSRRLDYFKNRGWLLASLGTAALVLVGLIGIWAGRTPPQADPHFAGPVAPPDDGDEEFVAPDPTHYRPVRLDRNVASGDPPADPPVAAEKPDPVVARPTDVVAFVDGRIRQGWQDAGVTASTSANDSEWLRRVFLDLTGHIPAAADVEAFLADDASDKRDRVVDRLLSSPDFDRHFATVWTNLLIGRADPAVGDRTALFAYLRQAFSQNRPWDETVASFVAAEGPIDANPQANFLVAHLNNEAVPATAITARVFLGTQVQCMQCHHHPFNDWTQQDFWELNSFFQQTELVRNEQGVPTLVSKEIGGPTLFETLGGLMKAAYPKYAGHEIPEDPTVDRRSELAKLLGEGERPQLAVAFVNRVWAHLLGAGFVNPVDDMGPHNVASHPEALDELARAFVDADYDVKRLVKWITATEAYRLSSRFNATNGEDDPAAGQIPLFSRAYPKAMTVEQVYDSLIVATRSELPSSDGISERDAWVRQFVRTYETDENDESTAKTGTVPVALALMNGETVRDQLQPTPGSTLYTVLNGAGDESRKLEQLSLATLGRPLAARESASLRRMVRQSVAAAPLPERPRAVAAAYEDALWAMVNSGEFVIVP